MIAGKIVSIINHGTIIQLYIDNHTEKDIECKEFIQQLKNRTYT